MRLAIFDLDNTLIAGDSDHAWGEFLIGRQLVDAAAYRASNDAFYQDYKDGTLDIIAYQEFVLAFLQKHPIEQLEIWHQQFMSEVISPMMLPAAKDLIEQHRCKGHELMIITATNDFITAPIARYLEIPNLIATQAELNKKGYTGRVKGTPSYQHGKIARLEQWLKQHGQRMEESWFYSDSHNDLPLLKQVDHPVAVNPDKTLETFAKENGWPVISLR